MTIMATLTDRDGDHLGTTQLFDVLPRVGETVGFTSVDKQWREALVLKVAHQLRGHPSDASSVRIFVLLDVDASQL